MIALLPLQLPLRKTLLRFKKTIYFFIILSLFGDVYEKFSYSRARSFHYIEISIHVMKS